VTTGEGGLVADRTTTLSARRMVLFINKAWGYGETRSRTTNSWP